MMTFYIVCLRVANPTNFLFYDSMIMAWAQQTIGKDRNLQALHLIDNAAYKQKGH